MTFVYDWQHVNSDKINKDIGLFSRTFTQNRSVKAFKVLISKKSSSCELPFHINSAICRIFGGCICFPPKIDVCY